LQQSTLAQVIDFLFKKLDNPDFHQWAQSEEVAREMLKSDLKIIRARLEAPDFANKDAYLPLAGKTAAVRERLKPPSSSHMMSSTTKSTLLYFYRTISH